MSVLLTNPPVLAWCFVILVGFAGELYGFRGAAFFIGLPAMVTAICAAGLSSLSVSEQVIVFALLFAAHALIFRQGEDHSCPSDNFDPNSGSL